MKLLVVAKKFNDIYYALSLPEWKNSEYKTLLIISDKLTVDDYPFTDLFDKVYYINIKKGPLAILKILLKLIFLNIKYDSIILSNIAIVHNKFLISSKKCKKVLLIEDGYMNYYHFKESNRFAKRSLMKIFGINQKSVISKIKKTYLLKPDFAKYYFGKKCRLILDTKAFSASISIKDIPNLNCKKIFIGQPLYLPFTGNDITIEQYNCIINDVIKKLNIDYYIPHTLADKKEHINCEIFDIGKYKCTFEILASIYDLEIYSISSTILYSSKVINPKCLSIMVQIPYVNKIPTDNMLYKFVDKVINL